MGTEPGFHGFLSVQGRGAVALPPTLRRRYHLDRPGAQVEVTERDDGVLELRPAGCCGPLQ
jgi:bifunctional DNA-binding transcriptional regulator/antitoxin component of YhaV-PrlF toxin-antitoxin module